MWDQFINWVESLRAADFGHLTQQPYLTIGAVVLGLLVILLLLRLRPPRKIRAFKGETGYVQISRHALLDLVHSACEQMPEVRKPSVKIRARRRLNLSVRIRVDGSAHLRDTSSYLQAHLKDSLENNLGVEKLGKIEILVTGIRASSRPKVDLNERKGGVASEEKESSIPARPVAESGEPKATPAPASSAPKPDLNPPKKEDSSPSPTSSVTPSSDSASKSILPKSSPSISPKDSSAKK